MDTQETTQVLHGHRLKVTPQRLKIVESLQRHGHLNIDTLYGEVKADYPNISLATVYKNIATMTETGILSEVKLPGKKSVYEVKKTPHLHLHCHTCGTIEDVALSTDTLVSAVEKHSGYRIDSANIIFEGQCRRCR